MLAAYENAPPRLIKELEAETKKAGYAPGFDGILDTIWYYKDLGLKEGFFGTSVYDILNRKNSLDRKGEPLRIALRSFFNIFESRKDLDDFVKEVVEEEIVNPIKKQAESLSLEEKGKVKKPAEVKAEAEQATPPTTPEILEWDAVTEEHFKNWLEAYIPEEDIATVEAGIREYVKDDPDILKTASWNRIRDLAEAKGYMIATKEELETIKRQEKEEKPQQEKEEKELPTIKIEDYSKRESDRPASFKSRVKTASLHKLVVPKTSNLELTKYVAVKDGMATSTQLEVTISTPTDLEDGLYKIARDKFVQTNKDLEELEGFPPHIVSTGVSGRATIPFSDIAPALERALLYVSKEIRPAFPCVLLHVADGQAYLVASDTYRIVSTPIEAKDFVSGKYLIPPKAIKVLLKDKNAENVKILLDKERITFDTGNMVLTARLSLEKYPDFPPSIFPGEISYQSMLDPKEVMPAIMEILDLKPKGPNSAIVIKPTAKGFEATFESSITEKEHVVKIPAKHFEGGSVVYNGDYSLLYPINPEGVEFEGDFKINAHFIDNALKGYEDSDEVFLAWMGELTPILVRDYPLTADLKSAKGVPSTRDKKDKGEEPPEGEAGPAGETEREGGTKGGAQKAVGPAPKFQGTGKGSQAIPLTRRRNIVKFLSEKLDIPIRVGRFRQKARGIFKQKPEVIRTRLAQDIPTISHEVGHYLDKKFGFSQDKTFDAELLDLGKRTSKPSYSKRQIRMEGVAEFMRLYLTNPQVLLKQAPQYYAAFESIMMANRDIHDVLLQARQDIHNWLNQPAKARVLGVISIGEKNTRKMSLERLYTAAVDELRPIQRYVKALFPEGVDFDKDPFLQAWLARGWIGKAETLINYGIMDKDYNKVGPSLKEILQPIKGKIDDFRAYITAKRAIELHDRGIEPGITRQDAEQTVKDLETPKFKKAQAQLVKFSDALIDMLVDAEILDKPGADLFRAMNRSYVPFYRVFEEMGESHGYGKTGYANLDNPVKRMKGSQRDIVDPIESIIRNTFFLTNIAERNKVGLLVAELAESKEGSGKWVEMVSAPVRPVKVGLSEIKGVLEEAGIDLEELDLDKAATIFRPSPFPAGKENILVIWREGQRRFYQLEPELYRALLALDKESANMLINLLSKPAALLRAGATLSPDFMIRNPIRDMWTAMIYSNYGYKPQDFIKGLFSALKKDDLYWKFHASGAAHGAMVSLDRDYLQGALRNVLETSTREKVKNLLKNPLELLRALSEYGEMATRIGEFGRGLKAEGKTGKGIRKAALSARDVALDYTRWGYVGKVPNRVIAFFNANVQGMDKMARSFKNNPGRTILRSLLYITLPSIILYLLNRDDERYQELPQWEKDLFWIILTPKHVFRIPKPFELGVIFGTLAERVLDYIYTEDPAAFKGYLNTVKESGLPDILPTAFTGWIEAFYANKSFFTGRPIVPVGEERLPAEHQYGNYTSETAKLIGRLLKISPRKADHIAYSYGGGLARYGTRF